MKFRLIARLDIKAPHLIKTVNLDGMRILGDPAEYAKRYNDQGIDEILYIDTVASLYGRNSLVDLLERSTRDVFCPVTAAGGIRSVEDARRLLAAGADKIAINTAAIRNPQLITDCAHKFGSQSVVLQIDAKRRGNGWEAWCEGGREPTGKDAIAWAQEGQGRGAGEILLTSIDREGTGSGGDMGCLRQITDTALVPVTYCGGIGDGEDVLRCSASGASGVAMAKALHLGPGLKAIRSYCQEAGLSVRPLAA